MPPPGEEPGEWLHAVLAVGYDDNKSYRGGKGVFIIANSWGKDWGDRGFAYLPYEYMEKYGCCACGMLDRDDDCLFVPNLTEYCPATPTPTLTPTPTPTPTPTATPTVTPTPIWWEIYLPIILKGY